MNSMPPASTSTGGASTSNSSQPAPVNITTKSPGRLTITEPIMANQVPARFMLGEKVMIKWKFDNNTQSLPTNMTLALLLASDTRQTAGLLANLTGAPKEYEWDTSKWDAQKNGPLMIDTVYNLGIWDQRGKDATPEPGYMMPNQDLRFTLYQSGPLECAACSPAAPSLLTAQSLLGALGVTGISLILGVAMAW